MQRVNRAVLWLFMAALLASAGCTPAGKTIANESQMAAKNWFSVIRGAQVVPLNPLRSDIKPGDIYLVDKNIKAQSDTSPGKGYLPLDHRLDNIELNAGAASPAAMPSFSFTVKESAGLQASFPIEGIPIGLGLVKSNDVIVSVSITDVTVREAALLGAYDKLREWAGKETVKAYLRTQAQLAESPLFLRVLTTVYYTKGVTASIKALDSGGATVAAGGGVFEEPDTLDVNRVLPEAVKSQEAAERLLQIATELNKVKPFSQAMPGGSASFVKSSANAVSMSQPLTVPMGIGYVGFDAIIHKNGAIGPPMLSMLDLDEVYAQPVQSGDKKEFRLYRNVIRNMPDPARTEITESMAQFTGQEKLLAGNNVEVFWTKMDAYLARNNDMTSYNAIVLEMKRLILEAE